MNAASIISVITAYGVVFLYLLALYVEKGERPFRRTRRGFRRLPVWAPSSLEFPCSAGGYTLIIPVKWYTEDGARVVSMDSVEQRIVIESNGTVKVYKFGFCGERSIGGSFRVQ